MPVKNPSDDWLTSLLHVAIEHWLPTKNDVFLALVLATPSEFCLARSLSFFHCLFSWSSIISTRPKVSPSFALSLLGSIARHQATTGTQRHTPTRSMTRTRTSVNSEDVSRTEPLLEWRSGRIDKTRSRGLNLLVRSLVSFRDSTLPVFARSLLYVIFTIVLFLRLLLLCFIFIVVIVISSAFLYSWKTNQKTKQVQRFFRLTSVPRRVWCSLFVSLTCRLFELDRSNGKGIFSD